MEVRHVWVSDADQVWKKHIVTNENVKTGELSISSDKGRTNITVSKHSVLEVNEEDLRDLDDLNSIDSIADAPILDLIRRRYNANKFFTYADNVLLFVNPNKAMPDYDPTSFYSLEDDNSEPHIYSFTDAVFRSMCTSSSDDERFSVSTNFSPNKSIIINGRGGSGKTELFKMATDFLIAANGMVKNGMEYEMPDFSNFLLDTRQIQESFGFAATQWNLNSSRFSQYMRIVYAANNCIVSASTNVFCLDSSRVIRLNAKDRNFHIFYQLTRGIAHSNAVLADKLKLTTVEDFKILVEGKVINVASEHSDVENFLKLTSSLTGMGFSESEVEGIWEILAAILHLGNIVYKNGNASDPISCDSLSFEDITRLLGVDKDLFFTAITSQMMTVGNKRTIPSGIISAENSRNNIESIMKFLYRKLFAWINRKINFTLGTVGANCGEVGEKFIGLLDITGFELNAANNSLEQICINHTSEIFHNQFLRQKFIKEQQVYAQDGIAWTAVPFKDNRGVIDLVSKKPTGLFSILEEHSMMNRKPDDKAFLNSLNSSFEINPDYSKPRFGSEYFIIKHYIEDVVYSISSFLIHNNENLHAEMFGYLTSSSNKLVKAISLGDALAVGEFGHVPTMTDMMIESMLKINEDALLTKRRGGDGTDKPKRSNEPKGVSNFMNKMSPTAPVPLSSVTFREAISDVVNVVNSTEMSFIVCFRANDELKPNTFVSTQFLTQYKGSRISESLIMKRLKYELKIPFLDFIEMYGCLQTGGGQWNSILESSDTYAAKMLTTNIAQSLLHADSYQIGNNYIFLSAIAIEDLEHTLKTISPGAVRLANIYRKKGFVAPALTDEQAIIAVRLKRHQKLSLERKLNQDFAASFADAASFSSSTRSPSPSPAPIESDKRDEVDLESIEIQRSPQPKGVKFQEPDQESTSPEKLKKSVTLMDAPSIVVADASVNMEHVQEMVDNDDGDEEAAGTNEADDSALNIELNREIHTEKSPRFAQQSKRRQSAFVGSFGDMYNGNEDGDEDEEEDSADKDADEERDAFESNLDDSAADQQQQGSGNKKRASVFEATSPFQLQQTLRPIGGVALHGMTSTEGNPMRKTTSPSSPPESLVRATAVAGKTSALALGGRGRGGAAGRGRGPAMGGRGPSPSASNQQQDKEQALEQEGQEQQQRPEQEAASITDIVIDSKAEAASVEDIPVASGDVGTPVVSPRHESDMSSSVMGVFSPASLVSKQLHRPKLTSREFSESRGVDSLVPVFQRYRLRRRIRLLFQRCSAGDIAGVHRLLCVHPHDQLLLGRVEHVHASLREPLTVHDGKIGVYNSCGEQVLSRFLTLEQAAIISGRSDMVEYIELSSRDVFTSIHYNSITKTAKLESLLHYAVRVHSELSIIKHLVDIHSLRHETDTSTPPHSPVIRSNGVLKSGWLYKKDSTKSWSLRYVTLTDTGIKYASKEKDVKFKDFFPLQQNTAKFSRVNCNDGSYVFCVTLDFETSTVKKRNKLYLKAPGENELHEWMKSLTQVARLEKFRPGALTYLEVEARHEVCAVVDDNRNTLIHCLAASMQSAEPDSDDNSISNAVRNMISICAWLVSNGCSISAVNDVKRSALDIAMLHNNMAFASVLRDMFATHANKLRPPRFHPFYTYGMIHFQRLGRSKSEVSDSAISVASSSSSLTTAKSERAVLKRGKSFKVVSFCDFRDLHLSVELYDTQTKSMIESVADIFHPVLLEPNSIWWGQSCYLSQPFDICKPDMYLVIKLSCGSGEEREDLGWTYLNLAINNVDTKMLRLKMFSGVYDYASMAFNTAIPNGTFIDLDFSLVRKTDASSVPEPAVNRQRRRYTIAPVGKFSHLMSDKSLAKGSSFFNPSSQATPPKAVRRDEAAAGASEELLTPPFMPFQEGVRTPPDTIPRSKNDIVLTPSGYSDRSGKLSAFNSPATDASPLPPTAIPPPTKKFSTNDMVESNSVPTLSSTNKLSNNNISASARSPEKKLTVRSISGLHKYTEKELQSVRRINTREYIEGVTRPAFFLIRIPPGVVTGTIITNLGGRRDRSLVVPPGVQSGDVVLIAAVP